MPPSRSVALGTPALALVLAASAAGCASGGVRQPLLHAGTAGLRDIPRASIRNANGSPRVLSDSAFGVYRERVAPRLREWARDPRLGLSPAFIAALLAKESGFDARAVSASGAYGLAQLTPAEDVDLRTRATTPAFAWMLPEIDSWPRDSSLRAAAPALPLVPGQAAAPPDPARAAAALAAGRTLAAAPDAAARDYFFDPVLSARAAAFWLRMLEAIWTTDVWPGAYGGFVRARLSGGSPLTESQLLDLITVAYNQGAEYVRERVDRWGPAWTAHLDLEPADYLERVRAYTLLLQR